MEANENNYGRKDFYDAYVEQINWDWLFFKASVIFGLAFLIGIILFLLW